jgi:hypothetical protein
MLREGKHELARVYIEEGVLFIHLRRQKAITWPDRHGADSPALAGLGHRPRSAGNRYRKDK